MQSVRGWTMGVVLIILVVFAGLHLPAPAEGQEKKKKKVPTPEWTDPDDPKLPIDFKLQGEYIADKLGCQVIALGKGRFQAVVHLGGLPGAGWDGKHKLLMDGKLDGDGTTTEPARITFEPTKGKRAYKAKKAEDFSATSTFPPPGQKDWTGTLSGDTLTIKTDDDRTVTLKKTVRKSPMMGLKPPEGALVLFDGKDTAEWTGGRLDMKTGWLNTDRKDMRSKRKFTSYTVHLEFLVPFLPEARDQGRGNSGFYQVDHYEVQILDSFGLDGKNNECGGIYSKKDCTVNACFPPLTWQTYDIDFTNAVRGEDGKTVKNPRITVKHNGITIQDDVEFKGTTGDPRNEPEGTPGPFRLQGHGNILQFRNIWVVEKK